MFHLGRISLANKTGALPCWIVAKTSARPLVAADLRFAERISFIDCQRQGLDCVYHEMERLGTREPIRVFRPVAVQLNLNLGEELWCVLDFLVNDGGLEALKEKSGFIYCESPLKGIVERDVVPFALRDMLEQGLFSTCRGPVTRRTGKDFTTALTVGSIARGMYMAECRSSIRLN